MNDIQSIMYVAKYDQGSVSWTGKPVSYFLQVIDRRKLELFFQNAPQRKTKMDKIPGHDNNIAQKRNVKLGKRDVSSSEDIKTIMDDTCQNNVQLTTNRNSANQEVVLFFMKSKEDDLGDEGNGPATKRQKVVCRKPKKCRRHQKSIW